MSTNATTETVQNRNEIIFVYDARDTNPNGNPLGDNYPRMDPETGVGIITDVRLKRYLRDQLAEDGHNLFVQNLRNDDGTVATREDLVSIATNIEEIEDADDVDESVVDEFLNYASDVRYFGATLSISADDGTVLKEVQNYFPSNFTGPVQFSPGRSFNRVTLNENYNQISSVIASDDGKDQGTFGTDHRIKYGLFRFHGIVNENAADDTNLSAADVERLDTLLWRSIKNQTNTRSKTGQNPHLYVRVEYEQDNFQIGELHNLLTLDDENSKPDEEMRSITDTSIDATRFVDVLGNEADRIKTVHITTSNFLNVTVDGETGHSDLLIDALENAVGADSVNQINVYEDYLNTLA